jgi:Pyruvate/2-oxoacid:ferredoxin oxidoreductase delta subunit
VLTIQKDAQECILIDWDNCKGCGICANLCPKDCIGMVDEEGGNDY